jgi:hypothetical protein
MNRACEKSNDAFVRFTHDLPFLAVKTMFVFIIIRRAAMIR